MIRVRYSSETKEYKARNGIKQMTQKKQLIDIPEQAAENTSCHIIIFSRNAVITEKIMND